MPKKSSETKAREELINATISETFRRAAEYVGAITEEEVLAAMAQLTTERPSREALKKLASMDRADLAAAHLRVLAKRYERKEPKCPR